MIECNEPSSAAAAVVENNNISSVLITWDRPIWQYDETFWVLFALPVRKFSQC